MKRAYLGVVLAVVLPALSVFAAGRGGGGGGGRGGGGGFHGGGGARVGGFHGGFGRRASGGFRGGGFRGGRGFYGRGFGWGFRGRGYGYGYGGWGWGWPYWYGVYGYPYWYNYPYGYAYPDYYPYDNSDYGPYGYYGPAPDSAYPYDPAADPSATDTSSPDSAYTSQNAQGYYQVGDQWGSGMKQYKLTSDQLVTYLKMYVVKASPAQQDAFRSGFIASAIPNGAMTYDQAMQQAASQN